MCECLCSVRGAVSQFCMYGYATYVLMSVLVCVGACLFVYVFCV